MTAQLAPTPVFKAFANDGFPLAYGKLTTYAAGTTTKIPSYTDSTQTTQNTNPITLNFRGECALWLDPTKSYKLALTDSFGNPVPGWPVDGITVPGGGSWFVDARSYGVVGNGVNDDTTALQNALNSLGAAGGTVVLANGLRVLLSGNLTIPTACTLQGPYAMVGGPEETGSLPYGSMSSIIVNPASTITLQKGAGISGALIYAQGTAFPSNDSSGFTGTAVTAGGDDVFVLNSMILGFNTAISSNGFQAGKYENVRFDCLSGISINNAQDIPHIVGCQGYPFVTIGTVSKPSNWADRSGIGYTISNGGGSGGTIEDSFCFGYAIGFEILGTNDCNLHNCWADGTVAFANSIGFNILGNINGGTNNVLSDCKASGVQFGFVINNNLNTLTQLLNPTAFGNTVSGVSGTNRNINVIGGDVQLIGGCCVGGDQMINIQNVNSRVTIIGTRSSGLSGSYPPIYNSASSPFVTIIGVDFKDFAPGVAVFQSTLPTVASAATVLIPPSQNIFLISGTTNFGSMTGGWLGRIITLIFQGSLTLSTGGAAPNGLLCLGGQNQAMTSGSVVSFMYNASGVWQQLPGAISQTTSSGNTSTPAAGSVTNVFVNTTFDGSIGSTSYTVGDIVNALKIGGILKP